MEPTEPRLPSEAIELYNDFIHGEISRRAFMEGVQRLAGGLAVATVINAIDAELRSGPAGLPHR